ncbi:MAG TPA: outer membrane beta-barrel protein [Methylocella sp.]|nr:outer membrane beta-barrel protein [Methylocella sp.]
MVSHTVLAVALLSSSAAVLAQTATPAPPAPAPAPAATAASPLLPVYPSAAPVAPGLTPGDNFFSRLYWAYAYEWGLPAAPTDPNAPPGPPTRRPPPWQPAPESSPPMPFADWPQGGNDYIGVSTPNSVDSPLMKAIGTDNIVGQTLNEEHIQIYGWIEPGGNVSSAKTGYNGNSPAAYMFTPNIVQLDQAVAYIERVPDTVQMDHIDWGFRISAMYGSDTRYTSAYGIFSNQLQFGNHFSGYDMPMVYGEMYIPYVAQGLEFRLGRYISVPDIEAQLAPNNYMYSHSMTYAWDNYTNTGLLTTLKLTKNWEAQFGFAVGTETMPWNFTHVSFINPATGYPGYQGQRDPGAQATFTGCIQYDSDTSWDNLYFCANGFNNGDWGMNNLQWLGWTWYHKFNDAWHISIENYYEYSTNVPSVNLGYGNTWAAYVPHNAANEAFCPGTETSCTAKEWTILFYLNYQFSPLDNLSLRGEFFDDINGWRTGFATAYNNWALGWQHWFSPQVEIRPEIAWYHALSAPAFDNGTKHSIAIVSGDVIWHF